MQDIRYSELDMKNAVKVLDIIYCSNKFDLILWFYFESKISSIFNEKVDFLSQYECPTESAGMKHKGVLIDSFSIEKFYFFEKVFKKILIIFHCIITLI